MKSHLQNLVVRAVERIRQDAGALRILSDWIGNGATPVVPSLAEQRADTCIACPHNKPIRRRLEASVAEAILEQESLRKDMDMTIPLEGRLGMCEKCGCYLKLKVWVPLKHLGGDPMPQTCWVSKERRSLHSGRAPEDVILDYYRSVRSIGEGRRKAVFGPNYTLTNVAQGLGDALILTDIWEASGRTVRPYTNSKHFAAATRFMSGWDNSAKMKPLMIDYPMANATWDLGNGHNIQRIRRLFGVPVDMKPRPGIRIGSMQDPKKVIIHLDPGVHSEWQRKHIHPRARMVYPENVAIISRWAQSTSMRCFTVGGVRVPGVPHIETPTTESLFRELASASWFLGIISGPMHAAVSLGLRCIVVINFPDPRKILLPTLVSTGQVEEEWFYPQNVHLHQDGAGPLVPQFSEFSLEAAFNGEVYPFWDDKWLPLINETV